MAILAFSCNSEFEDAYIGHVLRSGADGYVSSQKSLDDLIMGIRALKDGREFSKYPSFRFEKHLKKLSSREAEAFCLTGCGHAPKLVAEKMNVGVKTVESFLERVRKKTNLTGPELSYVSSSFMRSAARRGEECAGEDKVVKELLC